MTIYRTGFAVDAMANTRGRSRNIVVAIYYISYRILLLLDYCRTSTTLFYATTTMTTTTTRRNAVFPHRRAIETIFPTGLILRPRPFPAFDFVFIIFAIYITVALCSPLFVTFYIIFYRLVCLATGQPTIVNVMIARTYNSR